MRREIQKQEKRRRILEAALRVVDQFGWEGATVEMIASEADVSLPTLFRYYPTKVDLLFADDEHILAGWENAVQEVRSGETLVDALRRATLQGSLGRVDPRLARLRLELIPSEADLQLRQLAFDAQALRRAALALQRRLGLSERDLRPRALAAATMGAVRAAQERWKVEGGDVASHISEAFCCLTELGALWTAVVPDTPEARG